jgi:hypothetical protein
MTGSAPNLHVGVCESREAHSHNRRAGLSGEGAAPIHEEWASRRGLSLSISGRFSWSLRETRGDVDHGPQEARSKRTQSRGDRPFGVGSHKGHAGRFHGLKT